MSKAETRLLLERLTVVLSASAFSFFTLWLLESWIKYALFIFEVFTIILLYMIVRGLDIRLGLLSIRLKGAGFMKAADALVIAFPTSLLLLYAFQIRGNVIQMMLALLCTSLLSGYTLLRTLGITRYFSRLETLVLSCITSYAYTGFVSFVFLFVNEDLRFAIILGSFIVLGYVSVLKKRRDEISSSSKSFCKDIDCAAILIIMVFYILSFASMYPGFALLPGTDMLQHYGSSIVLSRTPDLYIGSVYVFSHLHESAFLLLSDPSLVSAQIALTTLNLMLPLAFYIMAKSYLQRIDVRLPSLATVFWVLFTNGFGGFAWLYFTKLKLSSGSQPQLQLLKITADRTYNGVVYAILGLWYVPATISFIVLMATIFLMCKREIPRWKYLVLFSTMVATMFLTHVTEAVVFALFLAAYGAISRNEDLRIDESLKSSIVGFVLAFVVYYPLSLFTARFLITSSLLISIFLPVLALLLSITSRQIIRPRIFRYFEVASKRSGLLKSVSMLRVAQVFFFMCMIWFLYWGHIYEVWVWDKSFLVTLTINQNTVGYAVFAGLLATTSLFSHKLSHYSLSSLVLPSKSNLLRGLIPLLLFLYAVAFMSWLSVADSFHTEQFSNIGLVPWFVYPLMLGINGVLAIAAIYCSGNETKCWRVFALFVAFMIFSFIAGKIVSVVNINFFDAGYWEKRFIWFIKIPLAVLAPLPILLLFDRLKEIRNINVRTIFSGILIGTIVLYGVSTTFLNLEYWSIHTADSSTYFSADEMSALDALKKILDNDPKAWLATVAETSISMDAFAAAPDALRLTQLLYTARKPEMTLAQLYRHPAYAHPYVYIHSRNADKMNGYSDSFLAKYLKMLPLVFNNSEVKIYDMYKPSFPQPVSDNALLIPLDEFLYKESFLVAYEILSHAFLNYTVLFDLDHKALDAKRIILPFDPVQRENILTNAFHDDFNQTLESWRVSEGCWRIEDGKLVAGQDGERGEGIVLLPISAENFTSSLRVEPRRGDPSVSNYVALVYSWIDQKNYRIAEIHFYSDGNVYVLFRILTNGVEETLQKWPGAKTDLRWDFESKFNITVTVNGNLNEISINGKTYVSLDLRRTSGKVGLRYYRFYKTLFDSFDITYSTDVNFRPVEDYLDYLSSGGKILLLNTNGYGFFADNLFSFSNSKLDCQRIEGKNTMNLPRPVPAPSLSYRNHNTATISRYIGPRFETPFISHQNYGIGELFYVNVYPIVKAMHENGQAAFYELLGKLLDDLNLTKLNPKTTLSLDAYVKKIYLSNNVKIETDSLLLPHEQEFEEIDVEAGGRYFTFYNASAISTYGHSKSIIETESASTQNGDGFYARFEMNSAFSLKPIEGSFTIEITTGNEHLDLNNASRLSVNSSSPIQLLARTPTIRAYEATFIEFYAQSNLQSQTRTYGQDLKATGPTEFSMPISDTYSMIANIRLGASLERDPPILSFGLSSTLPAVIFWSILLFPIFVGVSYVLAVRKSVKGSELVEKADNLHSH